MYHSMIRIVILCEKLYAFGNQLIYNKLGKDLVAAFIMTKFDVTLK